MTYNALLECNITELNENEVLVSFLDKEDIKVGGIYPPHFIKEGKLCVYIITDSGADILITVLGMQSGGYGFFSSSNIWVKKSQLTLLGE